ncbi:MAG: trypsin-like peptidase domain-containing protein, partial [Thermoleophilaceae bacterium]|nr:trypsin-like peptidase domain-containing protein [Thermoleophilaceae bacterium]
MTTNDFTPSSPPPGGIPSTSTAHSQTTGGTTHGPSSAKQNFLAGIAGGAIVAVTVVLLSAFGVVGGGETIVQQSAGFGGGGGGGGAKYPTVNAVYKETGSGVVNIKSNVVRQNSDVFGGTQQGTATGSGFVVDEKGFILTNAHVVEGATSVTVQFDDESVTKAKVVGTDNSNDLAVLKVDVDKSKLHPIELGDSSNVQVGSPVIAIGNPFGLDQTVTTGIVSALQREITAPNGFSISNVIQTDAAINPGNSGGPLLDAQGRVIGINSQIATSGGNEGNVGIGFAVPINTAKRVLPDLEQDGKVTYAYLGVATSNLTPSIADRLNLAGERQGALIGSVVPDGPADKAGLRGGDIEATVDGEKIALGGDLIVKVGNKDVKSSNDVADSITGLKPGDVITIIVVRKGERKAIKVK